MSLCEDLTQPVNQPLIGQRCPLGMLSVILLVKVRTKRSAIFNERSLRKICVNGSEGGFLRANPGVIPTEVSWNTSQVTVFSLLLDFIFN